MQDDVAILERSASASPTPDDCPTAPPRKRIKSKRSQGASLFAKILGRLSVPVIIIAIWQLWAGTSSGEIAAFPTPAAVISGFGELWTSHAIQDSIPVSLIRAGLGLLIGGALGLSFGLLNGLSRMSENLLDLPMQVARVVPFIALLPLLTITIGIGEDAKIALIATACLFPVYVNTFAAVRDVDRKLLEAGQVFGLSRIRSALQIVIPSALPGILVGIRYAMGVSLLALIVAEQINATAGVGHIIWLAQNSVRIDLIVVGIIIYALLGVFVDVLMKGIEWAAMPWKRAKKS